LSPTFAAVQKHLQNGVLFSGLSHLCSPPFS